MKCFLVISYKGLIAGFIHGLWKCYNFTALRENLRTIVRTNCDVKDVVKSSIVAAGAKSLNQHLIVAHRQY